MTDKKQPDRVLLVERSSCCERPIYYDSELEIDRCTWCDGQLARLPGGGAA